MSELHKDPAIELFLAKSKLKEINEIVKWLLLPVLNRSETEIDLKYPEWGKREVTYQEVYKKLEALSS